jgi:hypothetical protein
VFLLALSRSNNFNYSAAAAGEPQAKVAFELYDLATDIGETTNVASDSKYAVSNPRTEVRPSVLAVLVCGDPVCICCCFLVRLQSQLAAMTKVMDEKHVEDVYWPSGPNCCDHQYGESLLLAFERG